MLNFIKWPNFIAWLPSLREILDNVIICCLVCDVINSEINYSFLIRQFSEPKSQNKNSHISRMKKLSKWNKKHFFVFFKGLSIAKNCLRFESRPLNWLINFFDKLYLYTYVRRAVVTNSCRSFVTKIISSLLMLPIPDSRGR